MSAPQVSYRDRAGTATNAIALLSDGTVVEPLEDASTVDGKLWRKIRANGREGWGIAVVIRPR
jgi:hypothetical protein